MAKILVVGLNPAWQKTLVFSRVERNSVNRAESMRVFPAGKGLNIARVLRRLGHRVFLVQILGGETGRKIQEACWKLGIVSLHVDMDAETRGCTTIIERETSSITEIIEPSPVDLPAEEIRRLILSRLTPIRDNLDALVIAGQAPEGCPADLYESILVLLNPAFSLLDSYKDVSLSLMQSVSIIKINRHEKDIISANHPDFLKDLSRGRKGCLMITDGPRNAELLEWDDIPGSGSSNAPRPLLRFHLPQYGKIVNPIGAGDTVSAGVTHYCLNGNSYEEAFRYALAMGSASCLTEFPGDFTAEAHEAIHAGIRLEKPD